MASHELYALSRKEGAEIIFAFQPSRAAVWGTALDFTFGPGMWSEETRDAMHKAGWRVTPVTVLVNQKKVRNKV